MKDYTHYAVDTTMQLLNIDSPTGYTENAAMWVENTLHQLGYSTIRTNKGGVLATLGGESNGLVLSAHIDTLGGMIAEIKSDGRLRLTNIGGMNANNAEAENVTIYTRDGKQYQGTFQLCNASVHVNSDYNKNERNYTTCEVVLDERVTSKKDVDALGIAVGDIVAFEPRCRMSGDGYIKSRFLDDKLSAGILIAFAKYIADHKIVLSRKIYLYFTVFEEVGHGCSSSIPSDVTELLAVDMGCVGNSLNCTELNVSICAKDSHGPYNYNMISRLINAANKQGASYALDVYPFYGSDADAALNAGADVRHALIGAGVYASHGYERSHIEGVENTLKLLVGFIDE